MGAQRLKLLFVAVVGIVWATVASARPITQYSPDGDMWRLVNHDRRAYYCWITLGDGSQFEKVIYANTATRWYSTRGGFVWDCKT
jgi:hypothetical protein